MAKLSARGRQEVVRLEKHTETPLDPNHEWTRRVYVMASDGRLLVKDTWKWRSERHPYSPGWKDAGCWGPTHPRDARAWIVKRHHDEYTVTPGPAWDMLQADAKDVTEDLEILQAN